MSKKVKTVITALISLLIIVVVLIGGFFMIFPMKPEVEIKSAQERIKNNNNIKLNNFLINHLNQLSSPFFCI